MTDLHCVRQKRALAGRVIPVLYLISLLFSVARLAVDLGRFQGSPAVSCAPFDSFGLGIGIPLE